MPFTRGARHRPSHWHLWGVNKRWVLGWAITGFVVVVIMSITLLVLWNVYIISDFRTISQLSRNAAAVMPVNPEHRDPTVRWVVLAMGSTFFTVIITALSLFFAAYLVSRRYQRIQTDWLATTTHELKLPTANVQLFAQTLQKPGLAESDRERFLSLILRESQRMDDLVTRILTTRRIETGMQEIRLENIAALAWLGSCRKRPASPAFELEGTREARIRVDRRQLEIVIDNLVQNAHKYGDGTTPRVVVMASEGFVTIEVRDKGIGVPVTLRKKVFKRFYRIPGREHRRRTGTGLGLYIARSLVKLMGGQMGVRDNPDGKGSAFWMTFKEVV